MERMPHLTRGQAPDFALAIAETYPGQASWAGWNGAPGEICADCKYFAERDRGWKREGLCLKAKALSQNRKKTLPRIPASARACRYWEASNQE